MSQPKRSPSPSTAAAAGAPTVVVTTTETTPAPIVIENDDQAQNSRRLALGAYNEGRLEEALRYQHATLVYMTGKHGMVHPQCGLSYLDYGMTLLAMIQARDPADAALAANSGLKKEKADAPTGGEDATAASDDDDGSDSEEKKEGGGVEEDEDAKICYENLQASILCFEKATGDASQLMPVALREAESHDALAQLWQELDNEEQALAEFGLALSLRERYLPENDRLVIATLYSMSMSLMREEDYDEAEKYLNKAIALAEGVHRPGGVETGAANGATTVTATQSVSTVPAEMIQEMKNYLQEIAEVRASGGMSTIREQIRQQFVDETSQVKDPDQVLTAEGTEVVAAPPTTSTSSTRNTLMTAMPAGAMISSVSRSLLSGVPGANGGSDDNGHNECSISHFPTADHDSIPLPATSSVNVVTVRRKTRRSESTGGDGAPGKEARTE